MRNPIDRALAPDFDSARAELARIRTRRSLLRDLIHGSLDSIYKEDERLHERERELLDELNTLRIMRQRAKEADR